MTRRLSPILRASVSLAIFLSAGLALWDCAGAGEKSGPKVLLIGIDAAEWDVMGPLLDQGKLPNLARLRAEGASGKIRTLEPLTKSPIIWASIATGKTPNKHGVSDFTVKRRAKERAEKIEAGEDLEDVPVTSNLWQARPIWDILGSLGKTVGVVGWWTTWPAQPVNGFLVSDYVQYDSGSWPIRDARLTYPASVDSLVRAYRRTPESVSWAEIFQFAPPFDTTRIPPRHVELLSDVRWIYAADMTFYRIALDLYRRERPEFMAVYFRGIDAMSHRYWDIDLPGSFNPPISDEEYAWMKRLIPNYYIFTDRLIGAFLREADRSTNVLVCSDHGFMGGGKGVMAHKADGAVFLRGPRVRKGVSVAGATVLDVTPTVLALYGLPVAQDMDGRPIEDALPSGLVKRVTRDKRLMTYETGRKRGEGEEPLRSPVDEELRERLRSLGYLQ